MKVYGRSQRQRLEEAEVDVRNIVARRIHCDGKDASLGCRNAWGMTSATKRPPVITITNTGA